MRSTRVYGWMGVGHPSASVVMGMADERMVDIWLPDQISGPPRGCRSSAMSVAMVRAMMEGQSGLPPRWV
jgi:hypothetical protein